jgi:hypothetical protein
MAKPTLQDLHDLFEALHSDHVICEPDLLPITMNWDQRARAGAPISRLYKNLKRIDSSVPFVEAAKVLRQTPQNYHAYSAPLSIRMMELLDSVPDEKDRIAEVVWMLETYASTTGVNGLRSLTLTVADAAFEYLAFTKSENLGHFADLILSKAKTSSAMVRAILCPAPSADIPQGTVLLAQFREAIERQGGITTWSKENLDSKSRPLMHAFTQWPEVLDSMTRKARGRLLENDLGL